MAAGDRPPRTKDAERIVIERLAARGIVLSALQASELAAAAVRLQQMKDLVRRHVAAPYPAACGADKKK